MLFMIIQDPIYGSFEINEPVLCELIASKSMQRLKKIEQHGMPKKFQLFPSFSRYEHCVGVMLLLRKLDASLKEQVAGLLHDISHTAFSHIIDWVVGSQQDESFQDNNHLKILNNGEISTILKRYGFSAEELAQLELFSLLEQHVPNLCADRLDYSLREIAQWANPSCIPLCTKSLAVHDQKIIFTSSQAAKLFAYAYLKCEENHWGAVVPILQYDIFSKILKRGLEIGILTFTDFYEDDEFVMRKIDASKDPIILSLLEILSSDLEYIEDRNNPQIDLKTKFRHVDPFFLEKGILKRVSEYDFLYKEKLEQRRTFIERGIKVSLI